jgi:hypothetical protein
MTTPRRIVVTGLAATFPLGGVFWDYAQYVLGFQRLGHEVLYLEDTGRWCYDPGASTFIESGSSSAALLERHLAAMDAELADRWFFRDAAGQTFGRPWPDVVDFCRAADLFLHISASCWMREEYLAAQTLAFLDSDPMYTQASIPAYLAGTADEDARRRIEMLKQHDVFFTFGENIGAADCRVPAGLFNWIATRQPIVLSCWENASVSVSARRRVLTTVASWEPSENGPIIDDVAYRGKSTELERFIDLPQRSTVPLEVALSGPAPYERLRSCGWWIRDGYEVSADPWIYRDYLARSLGEWSVAKNAYVAGRTGWFSCRTACYLALGVPAVVQDTGFSRFLPVGEGLLAFQTAEEALDAIERVAREPQRHVAAAQSIARQCFDSDKVLTQLLEQAEGAGRRTAAVEIAS